MKTQGINFDQTLLDITNLMTASVKSFKLNKLSITPKFSTDKVGYYLLPLVKQIFRDNFMGSDAEMGILLVFLKGYFSSAADAIKNNAITDLFKKFRGGKNDVVVLNTERIYNHPQAA
jgi:hypothetical protein